MSERLDACDYRMIHYFIEERGDIERWSAWPNKRHLIHRDHPDLIAALAGVTVANRILAAVLKTIPEPE